MARSNTYFWEGVTLPEPWATVAARFTDRAATIDARRAAFLQMLSSVLPAVRGSALDNFTFDNAQARHGEIAQDVYDGVNAEIRTCALQELASTPYVRGEPGAVVPVGANHASALHALSCVGQPEDAAAVGKTLGQTTDLLVLEVGLGAAHAVLYRQPEIEPALARSLRRVITDGSQTTRLRVSAIVAASHSRSAAATPWLLDALGDADLAVAAAAGRALLERDPTAFADAVVSRATSWPTEGTVPHDVIAVRKLLARR
jgi:hypothetical protein